MAPNWEPGTQYNYNDVVEYNGSTYKIIQPHRSQSDWTPDIVPALWGKIPGGGHGHYQGQQQPQQPPQQQYQQPPPQQQQPPQQTHGYQPPPLPQSGDVKPSDQSVNVPPEEAKKKWYELDDDRKKQLEIGGGLLAGVAAIGAGYYAYKEHEKNEEEKKAEQWALSNWLREAQARSQHYAQYGPQGPAQWVLVDGPNIPRNALLVGEEKTWQMYSCRAYIDGGIQLGKASPAFKKGGVLGYKNDEIHVGTYEVLLGDERGLKWVSAHGNLNVNALGARPVEGGRENNGTPIYIARAYYKNATHPGKCGEALGGAYIPYDGREKKLDDYQVLCYA